MTALDATDQDEHQHPLTNKPCDIRDRWSDCLQCRLPRDRIPAKIVVGVLPGEGVGPEVIASAITVLNAAASATGLKVEVRYGSEIGREAERAQGRPLTDEVIQFCEEIFQLGGAILSGPGGGRFVYDLRRRFDLFFKISPIQSQHCFTVSLRFQPGAIRDIDVLIVREGRDGCYQGEWDERCDRDGGRMAIQKISYSEQRVRRFLDAAARLAGLRRGRLTVVWKESGVPSISRLWRDCADAVAAERGVECCLIDIDLMAYQLIQETAGFDVVAAPNLFGDVLSDLGAALLGS